MLRGSSIAVARRYTVFSTPGRCRHAAQCPSCPPAARSRGMGAPALLVLWERRNPRPVSRRRCRRWQDLRRVLLEGVADFSTRVPEAPARLTEVPATSERREAALQEPALRFLLRQRQGALVRGARVGGAAEA